MDESYWDSFYRQRRPEIAEPSTFARACLSELSPGKVLFELGCGNGRDALFFAEQGLRVIACDQSGTAIESLRQSIRGRAFTHVPQFVKADFTALGGEFSAIDYIYSRFTLHAVRKQEASSALAWSARSLRPGGKLLVEVRSVQGSLYGVGQPLERDAFLHDGHYRRFVRLEELKEELTGLGFSISNHVERSGLAVHKGDDPVVIRVTATR